MTAGRGLVDHRRAAADHVEFLRNLSDLSKSARERGHHLHCYSEL